MRKNKYFVYRTKMDSRVRPEHAILEGITRPYNDKFWISYSPPNGWLCRCRLTQKYSDVDIKTDISTRALRYNIHKAVPGIWRFNAAVEKTVFSPKHPYFKVPKDKRDWAKKNFGLPMPKKRFPTPRLVKENGI